ncbi:MAG TPA: 3'(2'),5'-bisphosphate nucleotidase CysQ [Steroidobacteraceae bacterium]|nr:3'(2'),5'-bisphosphate nucleotidase CysQ [Steroidobacteraceae bacterium]
MTDSELLEAMIRAAAAAGRAVQQIYRAGFQVRMKEDHSPVTDADQASEALILSALARCAPDIPVIAEESSGGAAGAVGTREFFLVDPLDGTKEFIAHRGEFTVNIALVRAATPVLGVVYAPADQRLYAGDAPARHALRLIQDPFAQTAGPRERIHVRAVPPAGVTAVASRSHRSPETDAYLARYTVAEEVSIGSSLKFCLIAEGRADLYPRLGPTMEWDTAAGQAVLTAAGGRVCAPDGQPLRYAKPGFRNSWFIASGTLEPLSIAA